MAIFSRVQIQIFPFQRSPKALYPDVIQATAATIHTDLNLMFLQKVYSGLTRKLRTLVGVDDLGFTMPGNGLTQYLETVFTNQRVGKTPTHNMPAVQIVVRYKNPPFMGIYEISMAQT